MTRSRPRRAKLSLWLAGLSLSAVLLACGPGQGDAPDADAGADASDTGRAAAPPDMPWLAEGAPTIAKPMLAPCPEGWHEVPLGDLDGEAGAVTCDPYGTEAGGTAPDSCPDGWAHFVGDAACAPVGAPCPAGDFPEGLPTDREIIYVLSSAPSGGDGSRAAPLTTIADALARASSGTVVALGKGEYDEAVRLALGVTLWGACAGETGVVASSPAASAQAVITASTANTHLTNLRIGPADLLGLAVLGEGASVSIDGVVIAGVQRGGLLVTRGGRVDGRELGIEGTRSSAAGGGGAALVVQSAGSVDLARVVLAHNRHYGVLAIGADAVVTLSDVAVRDTQAEESSGEGGIGLAVHFGATMDVTRALAWRNRSQGVFVHGDGSTLALSDVIIRATEATMRDGAGGRGLDVEEGARVEITRTLLSGNREIGIHASGEGTSLTLSDVVVEGTKGQTSDGMGGRGLNVQSGAAVAVSRALFVENREFGAYASGDGTSLTLSEVVVANTEGQESDSTGGRGLNVRARARVTVTQSLFSGNRDLGVFADGEGTSVTLSDTVVRGTRAQRSDGTAGRGLNAQFGATVTATRVLVSDNRELGVFADGPNTAVTLSDVVVEDTRGREVDGTLGRGLSAQAGATVEVTRGLLARNRAIGVLSVGPGTAVELLDVVVAQTAEQACAPTTCGGEPFGMGLAGIAEGALVASRFEVLDSVLCGVMVSGGGQVDLSAGQVSGSQIGVCLQVDHYSVPRLTDQVRYVDNGINLDATTLPIPEAVSVVDSDGAL